jgi:hypothetical protein
MVRFWEVGSNFLRADNAILVDGFSRAALLPTSVQFADITGALIPGGMGCYQ